MHSWFVYLGSSTLPHPASVYGRGGSVGVRGRDILFTDLPFGVPGGDERLI